ncbi:MAG: hypothetical protein ACPLN0_00255 [Candidatus Hydrothermia bacterium]
MKKIGWFFFVSTILLLFFYFRFYYFTYIPIKSECEAYRAENTILKDSLLKIAGQKEKPQELSPRVVKELKYNVGDFFEGNATKLSQKGKQVLTGLKEGLVNVSFDSLLIVIYPERGNISSKRALEIKSYLVSLGLEKEKVWGKVSTEGEKDKIIVRIK